MRLGPRLPRSGFSSTIVHPPSGRYGGGPVSARIAAKVAEADQREAHIVTDEEVDDEDEGQWDDYRSLHIDEL